MGKRGPKPWEPTDEEVAKVRLYAGLGSTQDQIAAMIGKTFAEMADIKKPLCPVEDAA